jgi:hypothetical protein
MNRIDKIKTAGKPWANKPKIVNVFIMVFLMFDLTNIVNIFCNFQIYLTNKVYIICLTVSDNKRLQKNPDIFCLG